MRSRPSGTLTSGGSQSRPSIWSVFPTAAHSLETRPRAWSPRSRCCGVGTGLGRLAGTLATTGLPLLDGPIIELGHPVRLSTTDIAPVLREEFSAPHCGRWLRRHRQAALPPRMVGSLRRRQWRCRGRAPPWLATVWWDYQLQLVPKIIAHAAARCSHRCSFLHIRSRR